MDSLAIFLLVLIIVLLGVILYVALTPRYQVVTQPVMTRPVRPYPVMPRFGPYWAHGGQTNSGLLY